jgi:hypothetical protein
MYFAMMLSILLCGNVVAMYDPIMSYEKYATIKHGCPYVYTLSKPNQTLLYFGANHSCDPDNVQYSIFKKFWNQFIEQTHGKNCVVLIEGSLRGDHAMEYDAIVKGGGEGGLLQFYADQSNIPAICPEPTQQFLYDQLSQQFSAQEIEYLYFSHIGMQFHRCCKVDSTIEFEQFYQTYKRPLSLDAMKEIHAQLFDTPFDACDEKFFYNNSNPIGHKNKINAVARANSRMRDEAIVQCIADLIKQGKNVFIAYGATHAVMQRAAIESLWDAEK